MPMSIYMSVGVGGANVRGRPPLEISYALEYLPQVVDDLLQDQSSQKLKIAPM